MSDDEDDEILEEILEEARTDVVADFDGQYPIEISGLRNSFGMAFDPKSGALWEQENGDDSFSEINRADPG